MAKYLVVNRSNADIQLVIPAPHKSGRYSATFIVSSSQGFDVLPYAGSIDNCKRIAQLHDLLHRGLIEVIEE